jgi:hypothetical protein
MSDTVARLKFLVRVLEQQQQDIRALQPEIRNLPKAPAMTDPTMAQIARDLTHLKWMLGALIVLEVMVLGKVLSL